MADRYHNLTKENKEYLWKRKFDSKDTFYNNLSSEETGDTINNGKDTLDLRTDNNFPSKNLDDHLKKYSPRTTTGNISLLPNWVSLLTKHSDKVLEILQSKLKEERIDLHLENNIATFMCINTDLIKSLLENDLTIKDHDSNERSWLKANFQKWKTLIDVLQSKYFCVIFSEKDFSKTYICTKAADFESVDSLISQFWDQCTTDVKISPQVMEFVKHNKTFSDLELKKIAQDEIWIWNIRKSRLAELKKEIKNVTFQSYLLNENEYEFLCEENNEVLSHVEKKFHMKGSPYQFSMAGDIPILLQVNPLVSISCVINSDPKNIPLDSLIIVDSQTPKPETDYVPIVEEEKYKIFQYVSWNPPRNHISLFVPEIKKKAYSWNLIFEKCFEIVFTDNNFPHTIGITVPMEIAEHLVEFCQNISSAVTKLPDNDKKPTYILLFVETSEMMNKVLNILKTPSAETPDMEVSSHSSESHARRWDTSAEECTVEVKNGLITDMKVDVVVGSADSKLNLDGKVSSDLSNKAGPELKRECDRNYPNGISFPEIAFTKGYQLPCKFVFFGDIPAYDYKKPYINIFVESCLQKATNLYFSSIAFTALGTGRLGYDPTKAAEQMYSAIAHFKDTTPQSSLEKILIIIYPQSKNMDAFWKLEELSTRVKDSKALPPKKSEPLLQKEQKQGLKLKHQQLLWIPFINYSTRRETLGQAIMEFEKELNNVTFAVSHEEAEDLYFFFDLLSLVPDIVEQLCLKPENLLVPRRASAQFEKHLNELRNHCNKCRYIIPSDVSIQQIRYFLIKISQEYPKVKSEITNNEQDVLFKTLEFERVEEAKHQLDYYLGLRKNISLSKDRFSTNKQESSDFNEANASSTSKSEIIDNFDSSHEKTQDIKGFSMGDRNELYREDSQFATGGLSRNEATTQSTQNIPNICCFQVGDSLLVKVYEGDILNVEVDGIVNAANKWLAHAGGVAQAIINAAGDAVNIEGQKKRNGKELNDGEVLSTSAGNLTRYRNIIHAVGPMSTSSNGNCQKKIEETVYNSLTEANKLGLRSVALPAISSGIFGVPLDICSNGYVMGVKEFYNSKPSDCQLKEVHFVDINSVTCKVIKDSFAKELKEVTEVIGNNIHQSNDNSANIPSSGKDEETADINAKTCFTCKCKMPEPQLLKCNHRLCSNCKKALSQPICPSCKIPFEMFYGDQPDGSMVVSKRYDSLLGFPNTNTHEIVYTMEDNKWKAPRKAFLPRNENADLILKMLQLAFRQRLIFKFQESNKFLTWNGIHHKTQRYGSVHGYPDPDYFDRVTKELAAKGITPDLVAKKQIESKIIISS